MRALLIVTISQVIAILILPPLSRQNSLDWGEGIPRSLKRVALPEDDTWKKFLTPLKWK